MGNVFGLFGVVDRFEGGADVFGGGRGGGRLDFFGDFVELLEGIVDVLLDLGGGWRGGRLGGLGGERVWVGGISLGSGIGGDRAWLVGGGRAWFRVWGLVDDSDVGDVDD